MTAPRPIDPVEQAELVRSYDAMGMVELTRWVNLHDPYDFGGIDEDVEEVEPGGLYRAPS